MSLSDVPRSYFLTRREITDQVTANNGIDGVSRHGINGRRSEHLQIVTREERPCRQVTCCAYAPTLENDGLCFVFLDRFHSRAEGSLEHSSVVNHGLPCPRIHGEAVIGTIPGRVIREMLLNSPGSERNCA
jgi:hypothetical protein